jgi:hypothetical protein
MLFSKAGLLPLLQPAWLKLHLHCRTFGVMLQGKYLLLSFFFAYADNGRGNGAIHGFSHSPVILARKSFR